MKSSQFFQENELQNFLDKNLYSTLSDAKKEVWKRWDNNDLEKEIERFVDIPGILKSAPRAIFTRHISTPNKDFFQFMDLARMSGLASLGWEFRDDLFVTANRDKAGLAKLGFLSGLDRKYDPIVRYKKVVNLDGTWERTPLKHVKTISNENMVELHHRMLYRIFPDVELYDASKWYRKSGKYSKERYIKLFALLLRYGILFENFGANGHETGFTENVVIPSLEEVKRIFGLAPLVVKIVPDQDMDDASMVFYPEELYDIL